MVPLLVLIGPGDARASAPPSGVETADTPNDAGRSITVTWNAAPQESGAAGALRYVVERTEARAAGAEGVTESASPSIERVGEAPGDATVFVDAPQEGRETRPPHNGRAYRYRVAAVFPEGEAASAWSAPATASPSFFHAKRANALFILLMFLALLLVFIRRASGGRPVFVRKIAGLTAIEEAVGRATEMGRAVLYVPGTQEVNDIQTIYSMVILHSVAKTVARYGTPLVVPVCKGFAFPLAEETVRQGYLDAGHPEAFVPSNVRYLSDEQFAFAAGVDGIMLREKPAANLFLGPFFAESLILAETGHTTGAIQIAGTANVHQLPFFVAACDYTLLGEEFFAATAYISRDPQLLGALKAGDWMKILLITAILAGAVLITTGIAPDLATLFRVE